MQKYVLEYMASRGTFYHLHSAETFKFQEHDLHVLDTSNQSTGNWGHEALVQHAPSYTQLGYLWGLDTILDGWFCPSV